MIEYYRSAFGLNLLFRLHGSAVYRAMIPGFLSVLFILWIRLRWDKSEGVVPSAAREIEHPYAVGVLVTTITFLLVFRTQQAYARYWEAASSVHHMMSKWMDATMHTAMFHMQCAHYDGIKPPSYFDYPHLNSEFLTRDREGCERNVSLSELGRLESESERIGARAVKKSIEAVSVHGPNASKHQQKPIQAYSRGRMHPISGSAEVGETPTHLLGEPRLDGNWGKLFDDGKATYYDPKNPEVVDGKKGFASFQGGRTPPLFLQELAHLSSLMTGVALSTLRNDVEGAESPLDIFEPGAPWPAVDPDRVKLEDLPFHQWGGRAFSKLLGFTGFGRSPEERTRYNAGRPLSIIGGVSEAEIQFLQMARGPFAKTMLSWNWFSEFIIREHLSGSTGIVGPPIISRIVQFLGDGMIYYNHARKIMYIPFPFPHAQLSVVFVLVMIPSIALLMDQYVDDLWLGCFLTFFTVTALAGIHEVARELENPFRNIPNELPLVTLQAQYNEALIVMYAGYHPDHYWKDEAKQFEKTQNSRPASVDEGFPGNEDDSDKEDEQSTPVVQPAKSASPETNGDDTTRLRQNSMEEEMRRLMQRMEQQALELERLRKIVNNSDEKKSDSGMNGSDDNGLVPVEDRKNR
jgi:predicted membrane chloride channel (bestrophin family)